VKPVFADSDVLLFGFGGPHPLMAASRRMLAAAEREDIELHVSVEGLQEFLFHRLRRGPRPLALQQHAGIRAATVPHDFTELIWQRAVDLIATTTIRGRDAIHAATALEHGFTEIVTGDSAFVAVPGLTPVTPDQLAL